MAIRSFLVTGAAVTVGAGCVLQGHGRLLGGHPGPPPPGYETPPPPAPPTPTTPATPQGSGYGSISWASAPILPTARSYPTAVAIGTRIYVMGGTTDSEPTRENVYRLTADVDVLDTATGTWSAAAPSPTRRFSAAAALLDGKIYHLGGHSQGYEPGRLSTVERYDPATDRWQAVASMAEPHHEPALAAWGGQLYVFGGEDGPRYLSSVERYDPAANRWVARASMPRPRKGGSAAVVGDKIYLFGGIGPGPDFAYIMEVDVYDGKADRWSTAPTPMPRGRWMASASTVGSTILVAGGSHLGTYFREVDRFDPATDTWSTVATLPTERGNHAAVVIDHRVYFIGGCNAGCNRRLAQVDVLVWGP
jgi:kelch-like protein 17 (actinfilin)/kelch-like protein 20